MIVVTPAPVMTNCFAFKATLEVTSRLLVLAAHVWFVPSVTPVPPKEMVWPTPPTPELFVRPVVRMIAVPLRMNFWVGPANRMLLAVVTGPFVAVRMPRKAPRLLNSRSSPTAAGAPAGVQLAPEAHRPSAAPSFQALAAA